MFLQAECKLFNVYIHITKTLLVMLHENIMPFNYDL